MWGGVRRGRIEAAALAWVLVGAILLGGTVSGLRRAWQDRPDWRDLANETRYVWEYGETPPGTAMFGYLPTTTFALWPFMVWLPPAVGAPLYVLSNLAAAVASIWIVVRFWQLRDGENQDNDRLDGATGWAVLIVSVNLAHAIQANQTTLWTLALMTAGFALVERRRGALGGFLLGAAAAFKTIPLLLAGYLILRRRWLALAGMVGALVVLDIIPSVLYFGWDGAVREHQAWLRRASWHSNSRQIEDPLLRVHRHGSNFAYSAVLARWLREKPAATRQVILYGDPPADVVAARRAALGPDEILTLDPMPPREGEWAEKRVDIGWAPRWHLAALPVNVVELIWLGSLGLAGLGLCWMTIRTPAGSAAWPALAALWILALFWPSPMARHYYLAWALPAVVVIWSAAQRRVCMRGRTPLLPVVACAFWLIGVAGLGWRLGRWYGLHLLAVALLMAALVWAWRVTRKAQAGVAQ